MNSTETHFKEDELANLTAGTNGSSWSYNAIEVASFMHVFPTIYGIICTIGVIANTLVIYAVTSCKKKMVSDIYVLNLAIADMLYLVVMPFTIHQLVRERQWAFGSFMCSAVMVLDVSNQFTTVGIVTVLCIDRYVAIVHPTSERRTIRWTIVINALVWMGSLLSTIPVMMYTRTARRKHIEVCIMDFPKGPQDLYWYTLYQSAIGFIIPLIIITTFYSLTLYHVFRSVRRVKRKQSVSARRATKTVMMVIGIFLLCWSPFHIIQMVNLSIVQPTALFIYAYNITICLSYMHSCINPLMLLIFAQNYRERLCRRKEAGGVHHGSPKTTIVKTDGGNTVATDAGNSSTVI
ncbi:melanin concentrating hormone receptor 2b [Paramormyrops kingsleyae]|uniref:Melanin concentrating hormone receptor 2b n=1 Tax=Paramormyrops kingsleyae TaxID=1676925 RepID=A0A3B3T5Y2_9TELE|nr:melanin-concentrating hormone receptor 1-like [Paramormyrops kingsleyae]